MRDTSSWVINPYTAKHVLSLEVRNRYPDFAWRVGSTNYVMADPTSGLTDFGETWGDRPATVKEIRERDLPTRYQYGGFAVAGDSLTLDNGNVFRATSFPALGLTGRTNDIGYKYITGASDLLTSSGLSFVSVPQTYAGIGIGRQGLNVARLFFFGETDGRLMYKDYTVGSGFGSTFQYSNTPQLQNRGNAVAPIAGTEGYTLSYDPTSYQTTLRYFNGSTWTSTVVARTKQHYLNCHWFDAEALNATERLITFCVNGVQYATIGTSSGIRDPWRVFAFDPEFGGVQTRICKLTKVGDKVIATAWSRFAGGSGDYEASYYHLLWTEDGYNWAIPEEGFIGKQSARGKLHTIGTTAYIIGSSVSYVGNAVAWLGGTSGVQTTAASNIVGLNIQQDIDKASDVKLPILVTDAFDHSLLAYGNEAVVGVTYVGETEVVDIGTFTFDTPNIALTSKGRELQSVARGPLKKLIGFTTPFDMTIEGPWHEYTDFSKGEIYTRAGTWSHDANLGVGYCEKHDGSIALATVGLEYKGQFQLSTRVRITESFEGASAYILFWYEGLQDYYRIKIDNNSTISLQQVVAGEATELGTAAITDGAVAGKWYDVIVRYVRNVLNVYIKPDDGSWDNPITISSWTSPEPMKWYAGVGAVIPSTTLSASLEKDTNHKILVASTSGFPDSGNIEINTENIYYSEKSDTYFGSGNAGSIIRGIGTVRTSHPENTPVYVYDRRFEVDYFSVFQDNRPLSVYDACNYISTITGVKATTRNLVNNSQAGIRIFPVLYGHGWIFSGTYNTTLTLYFWTGKLDGMASLPKTGFKVSATTTTVSLINISDNNVLSTQSISIASSGVFKVKAERNGIFLWINNTFVCGIDLPEEETFRVGTVACGNDITSIVATELCEPAEAVVWAMQDNARNVLARLLDGRDAYLREQSNSVEITHLEQRDNAGTLSGQYFVLYQQVSADQDWASAMVAWGGEDWILVTEPSANRLRWTQWQTPYIYNRSLLRERAMRKLRKLYALKDLRTVQGPFDPKLEIGDEVTISEIRGIPSGSYIIKSIELLGNNTLLDMKLTLYRVPDDLAVTEWPILPGVDVPSTGE